ncbi:hypothetical protein V8C86DRAFT_1661687 [Haematococcus lacustris]
MGATGERLQLLRVKRRRCDAVAEAFVVQLVHAFGPLTKRMRPDQLLLHQIESNLHLEEKADSESLDVASANPEHQAAPSEHSLQVCRNAGRRFVRIATLTQEALQSCSVAKLKQLISDVAAVKPPRPAAKRSDTGSHLIPGGRAAEDDLSLNSDDEAYVFDMYVAMEEDGVAAGSQEGAADCPVIEVADSDDEFYWTWREAGGGSKLGSEHDSEDSNAESFYANSYPDEDADWDEDASGEDSGTHRWTCCADDEEFDADAYDSGAEAKLEGKSQQEKTRAAARSFLRAALRRGVS